MTPESLIKKRHLAIFGVLALTTVLIMTSFSAQQQVSAALAEAEKGEGDDPPRRICSGEKVSVTVPLDGKIKSGEVIVLLDTTASGTLCVVHVAANLPCDKGPTAGGGNDTPEVSIVAGVAGGPLGPVISVAADDTGFAGPGKTCVFHGTTFPSRDVPAITDVILAGPGEKSSKLKDVVVTITGTYDEALRKLP